MNVFEVLKRDHDAVRDLFARLERADRDSREGIFGQLRDTLLVHARAEQDAFYAPLKDARQTHKDVADGLEEHREIEEMLDRMAAVDPRSADFMRLAHDLRDCVEHHLHDEETRMFVHARQVLPDDRLDEIGAEVERREAEQRGAA